MPFDSAGFAETKVAHSAEIAVLDKMAEILASPKHWCKGDFRQEKRTWDGVKYRSYCLIGALSRAFDVVLPQGSQDDAVYALRQAADNMYLSEYNDAPATTHADVLALIAKARASFS